MLPPIKGFIKNTLIDWEGRIASEIFLPGCNFRCPYCHSPHLVVCANTLEEIPFYAVREYLKENRAWVDSVVISGGEPTIHAELESLASEFKSLDVAVKIDTNGSNPQLLATLVDRRLVDSISMDVKAPLNEKYSSAAGVPIDLSLIGESIALLLSNKVDYEFRTTVCSLFTDEEDIIKIAKTLSGAKKYVLQEFRGGNCLDPALNTYRSFTRDELKELAKRASVYVENCFVRGEPQPQQSKPDVTPIVPDSEREKKR
jgi:pyruvate formate lyase activating enzyme